MINLTSAVEAILFAAGDSASGASLVVRAIADGKRVAQAVDAYLKGGAQ